MTFRCATRPRPSTKETTFLRWSLCSTAALEHGPRWMACPPLPFQRCLGQSGRNHRSRSPRAVSPPELRPDSGGAGRFRGGLGQHIELSASKDQDLMLFLSVERIRNPAQGRDGGLDGAPGRITVEPGTRSLPGKGEVRIKAGETLIFETPAAAGLAPRTNARKRHCKVTFSPVLSAAMRPELCMGGRHDPRASAYRTHVALRAGSAQCTRG